MGRTYEAMKMAENDYKKLTREADGKPQGQFLLAPRNGPKYKTRRDHLGQFKTSLASRRRTQAVKTILVTGAPSGCGASTTAVNLAASLAGGSRQSVLLVDANLEAPALHDFFKVGASRGMCDLLDVNSERSFSYKKVGRNEFYLFPCGEKRTLSEGCFETRRFFHFINNVRDSFDCVIFDSAPVISFPGTQSLCSKVDGVILVLAHDKTRRQVALRAKKELEDAGANLLGVIINRRKHYIPDWIYRRL